jgi:hypothetical protein
VRDIIRKILKEQTEVTIPNNKKEYVDKVLKRWEVDPMSTKQFVDTYGIDTDMAVYIRQKIVEDLKNVPIGKKIWLLDKDFPLDVGIGNYDFEFEIKDLDVFIEPSLVSYHALTDTIAIESTVYSEGNVLINVQEEHLGEYELKEFSIYDALKDDDFGWEVESEIKDIIWEYVMSLSPLLKKVRPEIEVQLFSDSNWEVELMRKGYD